MQAEEIKITAESKPFTGFMYFVTAEAVMQLAALYRKGITRNFFMLKQMPAVLHTTAILIILL